MIVYCSNRIGGSSGAAKSAYDVLLCLLAVSDRVVVVSPSERFLAKIPATYEGRKLNKPYKWMQVKRENPFPAKPTPTILLKYFYFLFMNLFCPKYAAVGRLAGKKILIVNSLSNYTGMLDSNTLAGFVKKINVVRGSPSSFKDGFNQLSLDDVLDFQREFDEFIFVSDVTRKEWTRFDGIHGKPAHYIPNCCEEQKVAKVVKKSAAEMKKQFGLEDAHPIVACVGSIQKRKGQDMFLKLLPHLVEKHKNLKVLLVGGVVSGSGQQIYEDILDSPYREHFVLTGFVSNPLEYVFFSDMVFLPTRGEALPRSILEAMALGKAIVTTSVDGNLELIDHNETGLLFEPDDVLGAVECMDRILSDDELAAKLARGARDKYYKVFSRERQLVRYQEFVMDATKDVC